MKRKSSLRWYVIAVLLLSLVASVLPAAFATNKSIAIVSSQTATLAPGIQQELQVRDYGDGTAKVNCYITTADLSRDDVMVLNGCRNNRPDAYNTYQTATVEDQLLDAEAAHNDLNGGCYIKNFRVVAAVNGGFLNIPAITGIPGVSGALIMNGVQYWDYDDRPFFAILDDGSAVIGEAEDWSVYRSRMREALGGNALLVKDGKNNTSTFDPDLIFIGQESKKLGSGRHPRTCTGITADGKVITMVIDAQNKGTSPRGGATLSEAAQMMIDAGCVYAINMDGGGSSTYLTKADGASTPTLVNSPSDGSMRKVGHSLLFASTATTDSIFFDFNGKEDYTQFLYNNHNYDSPDYWATARAGVDETDDSVSINTSASTLTIKLTQREGAHSTNLAPTAKGYNYEQATDVNGVHAINFNPEKAEILRVRLKLNDVVRYSETLTPYFAMSYLPEETKAWSGPILRATIDDAYLDGGTLEGEYVTLTVDLSENVFRSYDRIISLMFRITYLREGTASIDSIYIGPKQEDELLFDFTNYYADAERYDSLTYGFENFNRANNWYKGSDMASASVSYGAMTLQTASQSSGVHAQYIETSTSDAHSGHPLSFTPQSGDVIILRYRVDAYDSEANAAAFGSNRKPTLTLYAYHDKSVTYAPTSTEVMDVSKFGNYVMQVWSVPEEWLEYDISKLRITARYFLNSTFTVDTFYIGNPNHGALSEYLLFEFTADESAKERYTSEIYGGYDFDSASNWSSGKEFNKVNIENGILEITPTEAHADYGYIHTGAVNNAQLLHYVPKATDVLQIRLKIDNADTSDRTAARKGIGRLAIFYGNEAIELRSSFLYLDFKAQDVIDQGWITFTCPIAELKKSGTDMLTVNEITSLSICFNWLKSAEGMTASCSIDYFYIGAESGLPTPHAYTAIVTAPTCTTQGYTTYTCTECGYSYVSDYVEASHTEVIDQAVAATCTTAGKTEGKHCSVCNEVLVAQETVDALGHSTVYQDKGNKTHTITCKNCDYSETASCEYEDGKCICGAKEVVAPIYDEAVKFSHSLTLENDISINFIGLGSALIGYDSFYLECKVPVYNGNELVGYETVTIEPVYNGKNYECTLLGITAKMMNDEIEAVFHMTKDGQKYYSRTDVYSVAEYAYGKLDSTKATDTAELKAICANLLRYGSMAQTQFAYRTDALVDAAMTDAHKAFLTGLNTVEMKDYRKQLSDLDTVIVPWKSTTLELGNKVIMCLIANLANYAGDPSELTMRLTFTDANGAVITEERPLALYNPEALTYAVSYDGLRATEMRSVVSAAIYRNGERVSKTVEYSIESYGARSKDPAMQELCRAMLAYGDSANAFFAN